MSVLIETTVGDLVFDLYTEERPRSSLNFLKLCKIKYYNFCLFHSVRRNFIAQTGDPTGTGRGGESIYSYIYGDQAKYFDLEVKPRIKHKTKGTISFVNNGNDKHGSQFFITMGEGLDFLDGKHTIFGRLAEGFDTLEILNETICDDSHKPYKDVRITHTIILYDPYDDPKGLVIPDRSPEPTEAQLESGRIGADEDIDDKGKSKEDLQRELEDKELQIGTKILETVGDINDVEEKPPENVLFVCKLNPITNADDLKIIFSRFGKIRSCEIIKDYKTGESLCYGFVEFKAVEACEKAYFKMDNVLIDDRRIHVDFCQSINKVKKWHKSLAYQKSAKEREELYVMKSSKAKKEKEKYSMVFEDEPIIARKHKKNDHNRMKEKVKKKHESESENERVIKKTSDKKFRNVIKEPYKRKSETSASDSSDERSKHTRLKKKSDTLDRGRINIKKHSRRGKSVESDLSADEAMKFSKRERKRKIEEREIDSKIEELKIAKKLHKKVKKYEHSDESDDEKEHVEKAKLKKKKVFEQHSDSDLEDYRKSHLKKSKKEKNIEKRKKKVSDSDEEEEKLHRVSKQRSNQKKSKQSKLKTRSIEDSDTEDYAEADERYSGRKKRSEYISNESSEEEQKRSRGSAARRYASSDDDRNRKGTRKKLAAKKKPRRRHDSSDYNDSSD